VEGSHHDRENALDEALRLVRELDGDYSRQLKQIIDAEAAALLEALRMFHSNSEKKLKSRTSGAAG
jgi:hypothetical protein